MTPPEKKGILGHLALYLFSLKTSLQGKRFLRVMLPLVRALLLYFAKENESWRKILWAKTMWFEINNCKGTSVRIVFVFFMLLASWLMYV